MLVVLAFVVAVFVALLTLAFIIRRVIFLGTKHTFLTFLLLFTVVVVTLLSLVRSRPSVPVGSWVSAAIATSVPASFVPFIVGRRGIGRTSRVAGLLAAGKDPIGDFEVGQLSGEFWTCCLVLALGIASSNGGYRANGQSNRTQNGKGETEDLDGRS